MVEKLIGNTSAVLNQPRDQETRIRIILNKEFHKPFRLNIALNYLNITWFY